MEKCQLLSLETIAVTEDNMDNITNITVKCQHEQDKLISDEDLDIVKLVFGMILLMPVSILGIIGNIVTLIVLRRHKVKTATNYCLTALAISDLLLLVNALLFTSINIYVEKRPLEGTNLRNILFPYFGIYSSLVVARITSLLTTLLSIERFVAVHFPMKAKIICNKRTTTLAIITIYLLTIVMFIPFIFKYNVIQHVNNNVTMFKVVVNPDINAQFCRIYGMVLNFMFRIIPVVLIMVLNVTIMCSIWGTKKTRESLSVPISDSQSREQRKITRMLLVVSFVFLICILPGAVNSLLQTMFKEYSRLGKSRNGQQCVAYITFFLEALNSAVNFIIYMALSARFKAVYREIFYSAKNIIRRVSFSREKSSFALRKKCESQSSFSYSDDAMFRRGYNRSGRNDSCKNLLGNATNQEALGNSNTGKIRKMTNGILYELSEYSSKSVEKCIVDGKTEPVTRENSSDHEKLRLVKQDTLETSVNDS